MASTGKTTNYELSQFIGTDKPSWLGDYNGDMLKIDTALGSINATATTAQSGVASAQSAASAAQMTANAAQQSASTNAQDIKELKANLTFSLIQTTPTNGANTAFNVIYSKTIIIFKGAIYGQEKPSTVTTTSSSTNWAFESVTGNIFKLAVSTIADNNNKFFVGSATAILQMASENKTIPVTVFAYFDGANTNFYLAFDKTDYTNMVSISGFSCDLVSALTGSLIDVNF